MQQASKILICNNMDYDLIYKMVVEELKNYLRICGLEVTERKNELLQQAKMVLNRSKLL